MIETFLSFVLGVGQVCFTAVLIMGLALVLMVAAVIVLALGVGLVAPLMAQVSKPSHERVKIKGGIVTVFDDGQVTFLRDDGFLWRARWNRDPDRGIGK